VNTNPKIPEIRKEAFTNAREKLGLSARELSVMACLSTRQIEQIESGEMSSFYGAQIKVTAAKKVARLIKLSDEDAFDYGVQVEEQLNAAEVLPIGEARLVKAPETDEVKKVSTKKADTKKDPVEIKMPVEEAQLPETAIAEVEKKPLIKVQDKEVPFSASVTKLNPTSQKKLMLWLSVFAALIFSAMNLRPLFFADKPPEVIVVKEEIVEPTPPPAATPVEPAPANALTASPAAVTAAPVIATDVSGACPVEEGIISYKPEAPRKVADLVYLQAKFKQIVCVIDASGKTQNKLLEPGVGTSFYGKPPFKVLTAGLSQVDVFFQGAKVRLSNPNSKTLILEASEVLTPLADRADSSQLR